MPKLHISLCIIQDVGNLARVRELSRAWTAYKLPGPDLKPGAGNDVPAIDVSVSHS